MLLSELNKGDSALIVALKMNDETKNRFSSLGLSKGEHIRVVECGFSKSTMEIKVGSTLLALRKSEAMKIEVEKSAV